MPNPSKPPVAVTPIAQAVTAAVETPAPLARRAAKKAKAAPVPAKAAVRASTKPSTKPAATAPARSKAVPVVAKPAKSKLVRDSFTIPKDEYQVLDALKARALGLGQHVKKSELLRAGIQALSAMPDKAFLKTVQAVPTLKTGRPKSPD